MPLSTKDQSAYETYGEFLARKLCDNSAKRGLKTGVTPRCFEGKREYKCIVHYDVHGIETMKMTLCSDCMIRLSKDCMKRRYELKTTRLEITNND